MSEKRRNSGLKDSSHVAASTSGMMIEVGLSELDATVAQGTCARRVGDPTHVVAASGFELPSGEDVISGEKLSQRSKYYPSHSVGKMLEDFFKLNPPTV